MSLGFERSILPIQSETVFFIGNFPIANSTLMIWFMALGFLALGIFVVRKFTLVPKTVQSIVEIIYQETFNLVSQITGDTYHTQKIFPIITTILVYFALANVIAIIPGLTDITYNGTAIFRTPTSDYNTAFGVSLAAVVALNIVSLRDFGFFGYVNNFFNIKAVVGGFRKGIKEGFLGCIEFFTSILNILGEIAKVVSLSFRLFGNVYAGQVLSIIIMGAIAYVLPVVWTMMSTFAGLLQGFVFAALVAAYYTLALKPTEKNNH